ncbi:MAG: tetratricopeptide repeat protein, partial [Pseudothermotoga sp.]
LDTSMSRSKSSLIWIILSILAILIVLSIDKIRLSLLITLGMKKAAVKTCKRILLRNPSDLKIRSRLAMLYEQLGDINQAVREYQCIKDLSKMLRSTEERKD